MRISFQIIVVFLCCLFLGACKQENKKENTSASKQVKAAVEIPNKILSKKPSDIDAPKGMVWISGKKFLQGAVSEDKMAMSHESPAHKVLVDGFFMDVNEVTNADFKQFVDATNYKTVAEQQIDWEELKKQLPPGTPKPHDSILQPGSLIFKKTKAAVQNLYDFSQWWEWKIGASWKHPKGPGSTIKGKENYPVVHISYEDAVAYCNWANRRLPTEAEWELAARGTKEDAIFSWGNDASRLSKMANSWEGDFPVTNTMNDGYEGIAPVKSYPANSNELYDMAGNVWEWTSDWYNSRYYTEMANADKLQKNPQGAERAFNEQNRFATERVIKGGSYLCNDTYCASYRISARMATSIDSAQEHLGFRTVATAEMLRNEVKLKRN